MTTPTSRQADLTANPAAKPGPQEQASTATGNHDSVRDSSKPSARPMSVSRGIGFYFWTTLLVLIAFTSVLVVLAMLRPAPTTVANGTPQPQISLTQELLTRFEQEAPEIQERALEAGQDAVAANVDPALDQLFTPVYAAIPTYTDFHYSVWGQYAELFAAGAETLGIEEEFGSIMREHLFTGFEDRYSQQMAHLNGLFETAANNSVEKDAGALAVELGEPMTDAFRLVKDDMKRRMLVTAPTAATGSAAATVAVATIVKPVAKKIVASTAAKVVGKTVIKYTGVGGAATGGALAGSFLGPVGTIVGGAGGAIVGWLVVDYAVVKLDEYFGREEFEAELTSAIDEQKKAMRQEILRIFGAKE